MLVYDVEEEVESPKNHNSLGETKENTYFLLEEYWQDETWKRGQCTRTLTPTRKNPELTKNGRQHDHQVVKMVTKVTNLTLSPLNLHYNVTNGECLNPNGTLYGAIWQQLPTHMDHITLLKLSKPIGMLTDYERVKRLEYTFTVMNLNYFRNTSGNFCQVIYSQFGLAIHQNDHQARRRFVKWAQSEIAVPVNWPKRSCDLTPLDYFLWGYVKSLVYADKPQMLDHLEDNIRRVIADIRPQMLEKVIEN
ncbi:hypothetical protein TNCV_4676161 [Trichonephila clavipes]|nr:hypothetical protein TNCV_4676161 [Trichonephila clavipes]